MGLLTIKEIKEFRNGDGLEDVVALGTGPLLELAETIDTYTDGIDGEDDLNKIHLLSRLIAQGLHDVEEALYRLWDSYKGIDRSRTPNLVTDLSGVIQKKLDFRVEELKKAYKKDHKEADRLLAEVIDCLVTG